MPVVTVLEGNMRRLAMRSSRQEDHNSHRKKQTKEPAASEYYYSINEGAARRAKEMNSFSDYKPGSATAEYRHYVDKAFALAQEQKKRVDPMYHEKIDSLLDTYARKLAANMNHGYEIDARVPVHCDCQIVPRPQHQKETERGPTTAICIMASKGCLIKSAARHRRRTIRRQPQAAKKIAGLEKAQKP